MLVQSSVVDEREAAERAVNIARRELTVATDVLKQLAADNTSARDPMVVGTRLRIIMASTTLREAREWLHRVERRRQS